MPLANASGSVRVVLSAPQLAAALASESIDQTETMSNRLWGGLQVVGGVLEMVGAGALCLLPEPASKAGCIVFGLHGSDTVVTGLRQAWSSQDTATLTQRGAARLAEALKVSPGMADHIGLSLDIAVPFGFAGSIRAMRASRIMIGRISLEAHEAKAGSAIGGHTIQKHVGKSEAWLRSRLAHDPHIRAASSFTNLQSAEWAISETIRANAGRIKAWARTPGDDLTLVKDVGRNVGRVVIRDSGAYVPASRVKVILRYETHNGMPFYVFTSMLVA
ncbi:RNase A-like domain-containing protein [Paraburkholderia caballeronis]|uniref:RNase A-like domain-containing protein n=1 Tax=Paraburkholderia caballeronis TaxID=416943 RepID=UPI0010664E23|nr:RNase A-like domain-containing protein [Paraburkholderia caballeronis]TDV19270.1 hypothetical protein C7408_10212 [Paraburkholderia caballeronis]TDV21870.1 hypothetical protein C7406_10112 [Paraburkholderia caballeronis]TDV28773.1 hypothetical protein C7404_10212 [Paraburkholderia caballeronis]